MDPHSFYADPDPNPEVFLNADPVPDTDPFPDTDPDTDPDPNQGPGLG